MSFKTLLILALALFVSVNALSDTGAEWLARQQFELFKTKYSKSYQTVEEELRRFEVFKLNINNIAELNIRDPTAVFGINQFADLTKEEFARGYLKTTPEMNEDSDMDVINPRVTAAPTSFDWRSYGAVTAVKDQGYCGSCWAFSATETIESAWYLAGHSLTAFSEQQIVSCDTTDSGCNGGWPYKAYQYVEKAGGMATEASYPYASTTYAGNTGTCKSFTVAGGKVASWSYATTPCTAVSCNSQDESTLKLNLASKQPASVVVDASQWSSYSSGVMTSASCSSSYYKLDHAVQLVGYNGAATTPYWIVRNSWGTSWGNSGYIYLAMGSNTCGVANQATMVTTA